MVPTSTHPLILPPLGMDQGPIPSALQARDEREEAMERLWFLVLVVTVLSLLAMQVALAEEKQAKPPNRAILLVAFGTSVPEAQKAYDQIDAAVKKAFPEIEVRWAYTSKIIRGKLAKEGKQLDSPEMALARMMEDGFTNVAVLSLHVIPGIEFHDLHANAQFFSQMSGGFKRVVVARPLLSSHDDMTKVASALLKKIPTSRKPEDIVLFMGHGSEKHPSDAIYAAMNYVFEKLDRNVFVATVNGYPSLKDLLPKINERKAGKAYLMPFMTVAGDHARNDMAGEQPESWKSILSGKGLACEIVLSGVAEYPEVVEVWLDHLREVYAQL
jgi:sirohydrochlorin cobaltochelatase